MRTRISTKGQVVLPSPVRHTLGLEPGDALSVELDGERIILTPRRIRPGRARIVIDPVTGLPVLTAGNNAPKLTSAQASEILADFP
jgi:AbrB family looped-hinge helix DNA binding protein